MTKAKVLIDGRAVVVSLPETSVPNREPAVVGCDGKVSTDVVTTEQITLVA